MPVDSGPSADSDERNELDRSGGGADSGAVAYEAGTNDTGVLMASKGLPITGSMLGEAAADGGMTFSELDERPDSSDGARDFSGLGSGFFESRCDCVSNATSAASFFSTPSNCL